MRNRNPAVEILLVGDRNPLLGAVAVALARRGIDSRVVSEGTALSEALADSVPDAVLFDHASPKDLCLDPRRHGYCGLVLLLTDDVDPTPTLEFLRTQRMLRKPFSLASLYEQVALLAVG
jgi:DNA-binding response OmpR family regulator